MRIISGFLGGRRFNSPGTFKTHPMSDKMRGALFNVLGDIEGLTVLDAFAGSGALAFEAISRGASQAVLIEQDRTAQRTINDNVKNLELETQAKLIRASAGGWLQTSGSQLFDLVLLDPPYNDFPLSLLSRLADRAQTGGIVALSLPTSLEMPEFEGCASLERRSYGDGSLAFYRKIQ